ncbi:dihydrolipoamide acetyltransferase family protein [Nocardia sp. NPDC004278]
MLLPDVGEGLTEAEVARWLVGPGDTVELNQLVVEVETVKAVVDLPCMYAGTVVSLGAEEGETLEVGSVLLTIATGDEEVSETARPVKADDEEPFVARDITASTALTSSSAPAPPAEDHDRVEVLVGYGPEADAPSPPTPRTARNKPVAQSEPVAQMGLVPAERPAATPPVRTLAKQLGIPLDKLTPAENGEYITYLDVVRYRDAQLGSSGGGDGERPEVRNRIPVKGVRRATAEAVSASAFSAPHVTEFVTIDATRCREFVAELRHSERFESLSVTPLLVAARAACIALREFPGVNSSWDESAQEIVEYARVNLGIAAATDRGLIVPNIKSADTLGLRELSSALTDLVTTARAGRTPVTDMTRGTFTITNVGVFGVEGATPILNRGESAILALGALTERPWVVDGQVVPRTTMTLSLSFDHRLVDGELGSRFLTRIAALIADPYQFASA